MTSESDQNPANPEEFPAIVRLYTPLALSEAQRMLGNREEAEEAVQDAFLRVHYSAPEFRGESSLSTWICRIVYNECLRRLDRRVGESQSIHDDDSIAELPDGDDDPLRKLEKSDRRRIIEMYLIRLTPRQAAVITLFYLKERSYSEVAGALNLSEDTVTSALARGRESLKRMMKGKGHLL